MTKNSFKIFALPKPPIWRPRSPIWRFWQYQNFEWIFSHFRKLYHLSGYLFWNGLIRLFMEVYLGMALAAVLNTKVADWQSPFKWVKVSNYAGLVSLILAISLPILVFLPFYCRRRAQWSK